MQQKKLMLIINSTGFGLRGIRAQKDYLNYLVQHEKQNLSVIVLAHPVFQEIAEETFAQIGVKVYFESYENTVSDDEIKNDLVNKYDLVTYDILTESHCIDFLRRNLKENYPTIKDNEGIDHAIPNKPCLLASEKTIEKVKKKLISVAQSAKDNSEFQDTKVIFLPFSGLKAFGTEYGKDESEKKQISEFMSFPFEDSIPAIGKIQKELKRQNIIVIPVMIQYGPLEEIHRSIFQLSQEHNLSPLPTSLDIDWNRDFATQVGFFQALNQWSEKTGLPNIAIVHGSSCLHLVEECTDPQRIIAFYATHTEKLKREDDGRIYHFAVAKNSGGWLRAIYPPIPNSHNYKLVAEQIVEQAPKAILGL